jgi:hypothetical protein
MDKAGAQMDMYEIVMRLIGPVQPIGEHYSDQKRLANMKVLTELVDRLLFEIARAEPFADRTEASMKAIGTHAHDFLCELREIEKGK